MTDVKPRYSKDEFRRRGEDFFDREIRDKVRGEDPESFVAIDIETGDFEVDADMLQAIHRLRDRNPDAQVWTRRVGSPTAVSFGGHLRAEKP